MLSIFQKLLKNLLRYSWISGYITSDSVPWNDASTPCEL